MVVAFLPRLAAAFRTAAPFLILSFARKSENDYMEVILALIGVLGGFGAISEYVTTRFGIEEGQLVCRSGWLFKRDRQIPLSQVQNVNLKQNLLERLLGVTTLQIETAGGKKAELKLSVLSNHTAEEFRHELLNEIAPAQIKDEVTEAPIRPPERIVYELSPRDLLVGGLTENHLPKLFLFLASVAGFGGVIVNAAASAASLQRFFGPGSAILLGLLVILVIVVTWIWGTAQYMLKYGEFLVKESGGALRISHGILTKVQHIVRLDRVEYVRVSATWLQRAMGRANVQLGTAGNFGDDGLLAPVALMVPREQAMRILREVTQIESPDDLPWQAYPNWLAPLTGIRVLLSTLLLTIPFALISRLIPGASALIIWIPIGVAVLTTALSVLRLWKAGYAEGGQTLGSRYGFFDQIIETIPWDRVEFASVSQPLFWRRREAFHISVQGMVRVVSLTAVPAEVVDRIVQRVKTLSGDRQAQRRYQRERSLEVRMAQPEFPNA
jgi:putative membrane protein